MSASLWSVSTQNKLDSGQVHGLRDVRKISSLARHTWSGELDIWKEKQIVSTSKFCMLTHYAVKLMWHITAAPLGVVYKKVVNSHIIRAQTASPIRAYKAREVKGSAVLVTAAIHITPTHQEITVTVT